MTKKKDELIQRLAHALAELMDCEGGEPGQSDDEDTEKYMRLTWQEAADALAEAAGDRPTAYAYAGAQYAFKTDYPTVEEKLDVHEEGP